MFQSPADDFPVIRIHMHEGRKTSLTLSSACGVSNTYQFLSV